MISKSSIEAKDWKEAIKMIEMQDQGFADTLAVSANPKLEATLKKSKEDISMGRLVPLEDV